MSVTYEQLALDALEQIGATTEEAEGNSGGRRTGEQRSPSSTPSPSRPPPKAGVTLTSWAPSCSPRSPHARLA